MSEGNSAVKHSGRFGEIQFQTKLSLLMEHQFLSDGFYSDYL